MFIFSAFAAVTFNVGATIPTERFIQEARILPGMTVDDVKFVLHAVHVDEDAKESNDANSGLEQVVEAYIRGNPNVKLPLIRSALEVLQIIVFLFPVFANMFPKRVAKKATEKMKEQVRGITFSHRVLRLMFM